MKTTVTQAKLDMALSELHNIRALAQDAIGPSDREKLLTIGDIAEGTLEELKLTNLEQIQAEVRSLILGTTEEAPDEQS